MHRLIPLVGPKIQGFQIFWASVGARQVPAPWSKIQFQKPHAEVKDKCPAIFGKIGTAYIDCCVKAAWFA